MKITCEAKELDLRAAAGRLAHNADECVGQEALLMEMRVMKKGCGPSKQHRTSQQWSDRK